MRRSIRALLVVLALAATPTDVGAAPDLTGTRAVRPDGAARATDPPAGASDQNPSFSPDGTHLVFTRFAEGYNDGPAGLFLLDRTSGTVDRLTPPADRDDVNLPGASWNAATGRIAFASDREETDEVWTMAADGGDPTRVTVLTMGGPSLEPSFSPDGEWIVFEAHAPGTEDQGSIWKVRHDGTGLTQLTDGPAGDSDDRQPNWSPCGDRLVFQRRAADGDDWDLVTMAPDGDDLRPLTSGPAGDTDASWSPDGRWIVYSSDRGDLPMPDLFAIPAGGGRPRRITTDETRYDGAPSWSPDGRLIAFESSTGDEEPTELWLIDAPRSTAKGAAEVATCGR